MRVEPGFTEFAQRYQAGEAQLVSTDLVADLETPVSAMLKLADGRPYSFLFESVEGGATRGRYSIIGLKPDLLWRCRGNQAEINRSARFDQQVFTACDEPSLASLGSLIAESRIANCDHLPPMASGLFGYVGYDAVRLMERLPDANPDVLDVPDAMFMRPSVVAIFDTVEDVVTVVTPVWPRRDTAAQTAFDAARERLADTDLLVDRKSYQ